MNVLVTGGAGYIGSHTVKELLNANYRVVVFDNLVRGHRTAISPAIPFIKGDICDKELLTYVIRTYDIEAVIHFAAYALVGESMLCPAEYYRHNVMGTLGLLEAMHSGKVTKIIFSSSAAVYGIPCTYPITEDMPAKPINAYGRTKRVVEEILDDFARAYGLTFVSLRYFNAAGAAPDGTIGEDHTPETHLIPLILQTVLGRQPAFPIWGTDYPTSDGTCVRDFVHVSDLAIAHILALEYLAANGSSKIYNLGSETGVSVKQVVERTKAITGVNFAVKEMPRRPGDPPILVAASDKIKTELGWQTPYSHLDMILKTAWRWHQSSLLGYADNSTLSV